METVSAVKSTLYVVATPIGNLEDLTVRAEKILKQVDIICCEDTRHSARLMESIGCRTQLISLHEHNEREKSQYIVDKLRAGESIALVSDAGTPLISDPGYVLVNKVVEAGLTVVPVPGVSAVITALSVAGLPTDRWYFEGFLPNKGSARLKRMEQLKGATETLIFYESSHRIEASMADAVTAFGAERPVVIARELTKTFETLLRGSAQEVLERVRADSNQQKGEFVVMVGGAQPVEQGDEDSRAFLLADELKALMPPKKAAAVVAKVFGGNKKTYYEYLAGLKK
ncbi:16S rRNA (cytidine(1402)-2'-O)-methyltransferase [Reinekea marinisedimentorum]|uniref:Ribosomal RNA small subunit methyltransferase I n=1 Tax=Reinekea marinisedimentorum TaxID=230495 RepID=A0A4V2UJW4_9GAMM|nr:16S rRNA (cytidine(1402)-2'-O)-methyltransferase [Reinekea marinisedimentorum]TCS41728.1 16S rRNA (cytidine1402-2'-O)-methyltransferase [Reinekea marinisedimentorum]